MKRKPTPEDFHEIESCKRVLPEINQAKHPYTKTVDVFIESLPKPSTSYTFITRATQTVLPDIYNYDWLCTEIEEHRYLNILR